jgi:hypothetical protein
MTAKVDRYLAHIREEIDAIASPETQERALIDHINRIVTSETRLAQWAAKDIMTAPPVPFSALELETIRGAVAIMLVDVRAGMQLQAAE